jgi:hypothetical protein
MAIVITYEPSQFNLRESEGPFSRLTVTAEGRRPLPFSATGHLSVFLAPADVDDEGGPAAFVIAWLDSAAERSDWKARDTSQRQLELF